MAPPARKRENADVKGKRKVTEDVIARVYTIHLHKLIHGVRFKKRAPRAIKEIKKFAKHVMKTDDVRIDTDLNKFLWSQGINHVPFRARVKLERRRNEDKESVHKLYTVAYHVPVVSFKGLLTETAEVE